MFLIPRVSGAEKAPGTNSLKAGLGIGVAIARFDTNVKFTDKQSSRPPTFVDATGSLGLPETDTIPILYGAYRFSAKHAVGFSYFQVRRESTFLAFDEDLGGVNITGDITFSDDTKFYNINYGYTLFEDDRSRIYGLIGVNGLDIKYVLEADGTITVGDRMVTDTFREEVGVFAPLPLFGLDFLYSFTPKWKLSTKIRFVGGEYQDVRAWVVNTTINSRYQFNRHVGGVLGLAYFDADVVVEDSAERVDVNYGYDALFLGLHIGF